MTDKQILTDLLTRNAIEWQEHGDTVVIGANEGPHNKGYGCFFTEFLFDEEGRLTDIGIWE